VHVTQHQDELSKREREGGRRKEERKEKKDRRIYTQKEMKQKPMK
jgi:hypothetical protein